MTGKNGGFCQLQLKARCKSEDAFRAQKLFDGSGAYRSLHTPPASQIAGAAIDKGIGGLAKKKRGMSPVMRLLKIENL
jgi:hypothetical protein